MHICFIAVEIFAWGKYGGIGRATRTIGSELVRRGHRVSAVVPRRASQKPIENLEGIRVLSYPPVEFLSMREIFRQVNADIYHSQEPSMGTYLALQAMPERLHATTFRDTRTTRDWLIELRMPSLNPLQVFTNWIFEDNFLVHRAVRQSHGWYTAARFLISKSQKKYHLAHPPTLLPTPVEVPDSINKSSQPTVCFVSRWDRRKRPELFFELAPQFPHVQFIAVGKSRDSRRDESLLQKYSHIPNLKMIGFIDQFHGNGIAELFSKSWVLINTAAREGLPNAFLEAAAHKCAILSAVNPDNFASEFGFHAPQDNFAEGLEYLLSGGSWQECGEKGYEYIRKTYARDIAINHHIKAYRELLHQQTTNHEMGV